MTHEPKQEAQSAMEQADEANGENHRNDRPQTDASNDTGQRYGRDESPA
jgi:hypothetical protein